MVSLLRIAVLLAEDAFRWELLPFRSAEAVRAENLFLRRQLALYIERYAQVLFQSFHRPVGRAGVDQTSRTDRDRGPLREDGDERPPFSQSAAALWISTVGKCLLCGG